MRTHTGSIYLFWCQGLKARYPDNHSTCQSVIFTKTKPYKTQILWTTHRK